MAVIPATCEVWIDGKRYRDGQPNQVAADPYVLEGVTVTWGRENTIDQPDPATATFTIMDPPGGTIHFDATVQLGSTVVIWAQLGTARTVVFGGRITDLTASFDDDAGAGICEVVAADLLSDLANRFVGSEPWAMEAMSARASRILTAVGVSTAGLTVATKPGAAQVSRMDVDRQPAAQLLLDLAVSTGCVLWAAYDPAKAGPYLLYEDPGARASLFALIENTTTLKWAPGASATGGTPLSACNVLQDPTEWVRAVTDLVTRVAVRWLDQSTSPDPTERTVEFVATADEKTYGARGVSTSTILTTSADATSLATGLQAAHKPSPAWRTSGMTWDLSATEATQADQDLAFALLGNVTRLGKAIALHDLPYWTPTAATLQVYIEGGVYRFEADDSGQVRWVLALVGAPATGLGGSLSYGKTDLSIRFADVDRAVRYIDMVGVGAAGATGPDWVDLVGTWDQQTKKWSDLP
jgi:hypothetical protein